MQLNPRYGNRPILVIDVPVAGDHPAVRQRQRLGALLGELSEDEWQHPSRCDGWTVQDVVLHLIGTNGFWTFSVASGAAGSPTELLSAFDPVATPAQLIERDRDQPAADTLAAYLASTASLAAAFDALGPDDWSRTGEAPPGHLPLTHVADHALWDAWIHERDIALPLGRVPAVEDDEVLVCLRYCAGLGQAFVLARGAARPGAVELEVTDPSARLVVEVDGGDAVRVHTGPAPEGAQRLTGDAVDVVEALSQRVPLPDRSPASDWLAAGLAEVFDQPAGA